MIAHTARYDERNLGIPGNSAHIGPQVVHLNLRNEALALFGTEHSMNCNSYQRFAI